MKYSPVVPGILFLVTTGCAWFFAWPAGGTWTDLAGVTTNNVVCAPDDLKTKAICKWQSILFPLFTILGETYILLLTLNIEELRIYCLGKKGVTEGLPFGDSTLVFKVVDKIFALADIESKPLSFNLKCDPAKAVELREQYDCVHPGYHMNKKHWNTVVADGSVSRRLLEEWIDHSYDLVVGSLPKKQRDLLLLPE